MSTHSSSGSNNLYEAEELSQIETRCKELRKEKDMIRDSQSQSFELIRILESHVKMLSEARSQDKKRIQELERELSNCSQEIDYLQDQLNARDTEINSLSYHIHSLELECTGTEISEDLVGSLKQELKESKSGCLVLMEKLENKEVELENSTFYIEKLEESISSVAFEYQCEIESMKLDMIALEKRCFEANKSKEEVAQENARMCKLIQNLGRQVQDSHKVIECLDDEIKELRKKLETSETNARVFLQKIRDRFPEWLDYKDTRSSSSENENYTSDILGELFNRLVMVKASDADTWEKKKKEKDKTDTHKFEKFSSQIHEYELLVSQLKEQLKEEKLKAREEAEDLAQEMAELRYQITGLLEEERKRRACIEQISLKRITELEAQLKKAQMKSFAAMHGIPDA